MALPLPGNWRRQPPLAWSPPLPPQTPQRRLPLLPVMLFVTTLATTTLAGAFQRGIDPLVDPGAIVLGLPFALTLMAILLSHEMGHYCLARVHGVLASLPYFLPAPPYLFPIGTFGAFIRMQSPPHDRRALFDVGAAGPWAGVCVAIPAVMVGLSLSEVRPLSRFEGGLILGDSLLFSALTSLVLGVDADQVSVILHPVALAGWFGLFVTCLNLLPVGQLDGGHVVYSLFGPGHRWIARAFLAVIFVLGYQYWLGWYVWLVLLVVLGINHPPVRDLSSPLDPRRKIYAWCTVGLFGLTFMPMPLSLAEPHPFPSAEATPVAYRPAAARPDPFRHAPSGVVVVYRP